MDAVAKSKMTKGSTFSKDFAVLRIVKTKCEFKKAKTVKNVNSKWFSKSKNWFEIPPPPSHTQCDFGFVANLHT